MEEILSSKEVGIGWLSGWQPGHVIISVHYNFYKQVTSILLMGQQAVKKFYPRSTSWSVGG